MQPLPEPHRELRLGDELRRTDEVGVVRATRPRAARTQDHLLGGEPGEEDDHVRIAGLAHRVEPFHDPELRPMFVAAPHSAPDGRPDRNETRQGRKLHADDDVPCLVQAQAVERRLGQLRA